MGSVPGLRTGTSANGMEFLTWGSGPKVLLFLPGGPGSGIPTGMSFRMSRRWFDPFVEAGYAVWYVTRRRNMPAGHSIADMAGDYADMISTDLGGRVDLVVGESYGGMIALYLAARHGECCGHVAIVVAAAEVSTEGKEVDSHLAAALGQASGQVGSVGAAFAEYVLPGERSRWLRRLIGPFIGRSLLSGKNYPAGDLLVEVEAEIAFDARAELQRIEVPVVLVCGDRDRFYPIEVVEETHRLIPNCALVRYQGQGHMKVGTSRRVPHDVLAFVNRH